VAAQVPLIGVAGGETVTEFEHACVTVFDPDVTVTEAVFVPVVAYVLVTEMVEPERESVPLQE